jgi:hypothetical protein
MSEVAVYDAEVAAQALAQMDLPVLIKHMEQTMAALKKKAKQAKEPKAAAPKEKKEKKAGSMPKGKTPPQLLKSVAWVAFTLKSARESGWEAFTIHQKKKKTKTEEHILMSASVQNDQGVYVYADTGKPIIQKEAMSLSKQRWSAANGAGTHKELYVAFEAQYVAPVQEEVDEDAEPKPVVVKKTAAEKADEVQQRKDQRAQEAKDRKEARELAAKQKKEQKEKDAAEKPKKEKKVKEVATPAAPKAAPVAMALPEATPVKEKKEKKEKKVVVAPAAPKKKEKEWVAPEEGVAKKWVWNDKKYLRNSNDQVWLMNADKSMGAWQGVYLPEENRIDASYEAPVFGEESDEESDDE